MAKLKIEDLKKIKEKMKGTINLREGHYRVKITVHMGTCGITAGARTLMTTLLSEIEKRDLKDIMLASSGCAGLCSREPMVTVDVKDQGPVKYIDLDKTKILEIFEDHIIGGSIVKKYALGIGSETIG